MFNRELHVHGMHDFYYRLDPCFWTGRAAGAGVPAMMLQEHTSDVDPLVDQLYVFPPGSALAAPPSARSGRLSSALLEIAQADVATEYCFAGTG